MEYQEIVEQDSDCCSCPHQHFPVGNCKCNCHTLAAQEYAVEQATQRGMIITIYHPPTGDCNATVTRDQPQALLVGEGIPEIFEADGRPVLRLAQKIIRSTGTIYNYLLPVNAAGGMFGGNFGYCSDSRFPSDYPLKIHDGE